MRIHELVLGISFVAAKNKKTGISFIFFRGGIFDGLKSL